MAMWQSEIGVGGGTQVYDDVASAQAASGADNDQCLVIATNSYYRYESDGAAYTVDGTTVLSTGDGGNTRWIGIAGVYVAAPNYLNAIQEEPTGFPIDPTTGEIATGDSTISFTDGTLTLSIQPVAASFDFYISGQKHISTGDTVTITDTEGLWYIYYNESGVLTATQTWMLILFIVRCWYQLFIGTLRITQQFMLATSGTGARWMVTRTLRFILI